VDTFDVIVIGLGPGGEHVAGTLAERGLSVLGVDSGLVGGECPYWGCIPSKMMVRAAEALAEARRVPQLAGSVGEVVPDWSIIARRVREEATDTWNDQVAADRFTGKGGTLVRGTGRIAGAGRVTVAGTTYTATKGIVVGTGSRPAVPPVPGLSDVDYWTNHEMIEAETLPASIIVLGGGAIGCELSQVMARFGVAVTVVEGAPRLLPADEPEAGEQLQEVFTDEGIDVYVQSRAARVRSGGDGVEVELEGGTVLTAERLLVATGRTTDPAGVGLDTVGVPADARFAPIDDHCRVADHVWAVGDLTGKGGFTHVSMYQAGIVIAELLDEPVTPADYRALPRVTFTEPEVAAVGMTETQARKELDAVQVGSTPMESTTRGWIAKYGNSGLIKLVADPDREVLVGATVMGPVAGEVIGALSVAVHGEVSISTLRSMIYAYPTLHRGIEAALADLH